MVTLANTYLEQGDLGHAAETYIELSERRPQDGQYALRAGRLLMQLGRPDLAGPFLERSASRRPDDPEALHQLGRYYLDVGKFELAAEVLSRALALVPSRESLALDDALWIAYVQLFAEQEVRAANMALTRARALARIGRFVDALAVLDQAIGRLPRDPNLLYERGLIRWQFSDVRKAIPDLRLALTLKPSLYRARYTLGRALIASGRTDEGLAELRRFRNEEAKGLAAETDRFVAQLSQRIPEGDSRTYRRVIEELLAANPGPELRRELMAKLSSMAREQSGSPDE